MNCCITKINFELKLCNPCKFDICECKLLNRYRELYLKAGFITKLDEYGIIKKFIKLLEETLNKKLSNKEKVILANYPCIHHSIELEKKIHEIVDDLISKIKI